MTGSSAEAGKPVPPKGASILEMVAHTGRSGRDAEVERGRRAGAPPLTRALARRYPQCLHMLELLQYEHFRKELVNAQCAKFIDEQQILHWQHYSRKRMRLQQALAEQQQHNNAAGK